MGNTLLLDGVKIPGERFADFFNRLSRVSNRCADRAQAQREIIDYMSDLIGSQDVQLTIDRTLRNVATNERGSRL